MKFRPNAPVLAIALLAASLAQAQTSVTIHKIGPEGVGESVGAVTISESPHGVVFTPKLQGLPPGLHGFHVHENPSCDAATKEGKAQPGGAAGGHYDPQKAGAHGPPWAEGHLGDLPALYVDAKGSATQPVLAPRLKMADLKGRALMVHEGGDNYADTPAPLGGGAGRIACGVIG